MSRLLYRLSYAASMGRPPPCGGMPVHQSPNTESNRRPSPYHGDALPTELLGRARKTLHGPPPKVKSVSCGQTPEPSHRSRVSRKSLDYTTWPRGMSRAVTTSGDRPVRLF